MNHGNGEKVSDIYGASLLTYAIATSVYSTGGGVGVLDIIDKMADLYPYADRDIGTMPRCWK